MKTLTRDDFINAPGPRKELVEVPSLGGAVYVRQITVNQRDEFETRMARRKRSAADVRVQLAILVAVNEEDRPIFTQDDAEFLGKMPAADLEPIINAHLRINSSTSAEVAKLVEEGGG